MTTRINFGLHTSDGWQTPVETIAKSVGYNFLCAKRHFEHVFADQPEIFHNGKWTATSSENVIGKQWHFVLGCVELIPVIGHIVALVERFFGNGSLPLTVSESQKGAEPISPETTLLQTNAANSAEPTADRNAINPSVPNFSAAADSTKLEVEKSSNSSSPTLEQNEIDNEQKIVKIQSYVRMYKASSEKERTIAATKIQSLYRMKAAWDEKEQKIGMVTKIQSFCRMQLAQLSAEKEKTLFEKAMPYIDNPDRLSELHRTCGRTPVYLHNEFVIKRSGKKSQARFKKMDEAQKIVDKNKYSHLVIPKARIYKDELIEPRLPILNGADRKVQIGFYLDHLDQFTKAVEEFTSFLCQGALYDITGGTNESYASLCKDQIGRYENVTLYLEEQEGVVNGKIGLIDLEGFSPGPQQPFFACQEAVRLFPYHLETIIKTAKAENYRDQLTDIRDMQLEYFKIAYQDHLAFVQANGIDFKDPYKLLVLEESRKLDVKKGVEEMMDELNKDDFSYKNYLGENPAETLRHFSEEVFPGILKNTIDFLNERLKYSVDSYGGMAEITSYSKLISARTLEFGYYMDEPYDLLKDSIGKTFKDLLTFKYPFLSEEFAKKILDTIFRALEGKEIAYYNPRFGVGDGANPCIFC